MLERAAFYLLSVGLGWILATWIVNMRWIGAAETNGFIRYANRFFKVSEIVIEEDEDNEEEDTDK